jgi:hypothetical protein
MVSLVVLDHKAHLAILAVKVNPVSLDSKESLERRVNEAWRAFLEPPVSAGLLETSDRWDQRANLVRVERLGRASLVRQARMVCLVWMASPVARAKLVFPVREVRH